MIEYYKNNKKITIPVTVVLALILMFLIFSPRRADQTGEFQTEKIKRGDLVATVGATGTVRARQTATLIWGTTGSVDKVNAEIGDRVKADQVLASLSKTSLSQSIILAEADLVTAQTNLDDLLNSDTARAQAWIDLRDAEEDFENAYDYRDALNYPVVKTQVLLVKQNTPYGVVDVPKIKTYKTVGTEEEIANADAELDLNEAIYEDAKRTYERIADGPNKDDLAAAQAGVAAAQATINMARLTTPFAGTVTEAFPIPGDQVSTGDLAFRVDNLKKLLVDLDVSEVDINSISLDQIVNITFDAILEKEYQGQVIKVSQAGNIISGVVNFTVTVELTDPDELVKPGMTAGVNIVVKEIIDAVLVPNRAVRLVDGERVVFILNEEGRQERVKIRLGASADNQSVVVGGDLKVGDEVILNPQIEFRPGGGPGRGPPGRDGD